MHACMRVCMYAGMHVRVYGCACMHAWLPAYMHALHACTHAAMHACMHVYMHECIHVRMHACMDVQVCIQTFSPGRAMLSPKISFPESVTLRMLQVAQRRMRYIPSSRTFKKSACSFFMVLSVGVAPACAITCAPCASIHLRGSLSA